MIENKSKTFSISPYYGRQLNKHWVLGLNFGYGRTENLVTTQSNAVPDIFRPETIATEESSIITTRTLSASFFARYYFMPSKKLNPFISPAIGFQSSDSDRSPTFSERELRVTNIRLGGGINYNINDRWRVIASVGLVNYSFGTEKIGESTFITNQFPDSLPQPVNRFRNFDISHFNANINLRNIQWGIEFLF